MIAVMIDVKVGDRDVGDRSPLVAALGEAARDAASTIDQETQVIRLEQVARAAPLGGQRNRSVAEYRESHA
jgi:hypothetical protein